MLVLLVKLSSLGDVVHLLPALTDAVRARPDLHFHWVVDEAFDAVPKLHPHVEQVIVAPLRRWRRAPWRHGRDLIALRRQLREHRYDLIIDAQGLLKSAFIARLARGPRAGFARDSAREGWAALSYDHVYSIGRSQHAVTRLRQLLAQALRYPLPRELGRYGVHAPVALAQERPYLMFLHGTTWTNKHWPEIFWCDLARCAAKAGWAVRLPHGNADEEARARRIAATATTCQVLPRSSLADLIPRLAWAAGVVGVDSGLSHLAAAFAVPSVVLYGPTDPARTGVYGSCNRNLNSEFACAPCLERRCRYRGERQRWPVPDGQDSYVAGSLAPGTPIPVTRIAATPIAVEPPCFAELTPQRVFDALQQQMANAKP